MYIDIVCIDTIVTFVCYRSECQYYFSLSWLITWFSHDIADADIVCRLFDFFMASHPIMPMYCSCAVREFISLNSLLIIYQIVY